MRIPPLLADFIHARTCKPFCAKLLTLPASKAGFQPGEVVTVKDLLYGAMLPSGVYPFINKRVNRYEDRTTDRRMFFYRWFCLQSNLTTLHLSCYEYA